MGRGELWSPDEKLCFSLLQHFSPAGGGGSAGATALLPIYSFLLRRAALDTNLSLLTLLISSCSSLAAAAAAAVHPSSSSALLRLAFRAFTRRPAQDTYLCNTMTQCLVRHRLFRESISLYRDLHRGPPPATSPPFSPDAYTFPSLLKSCASLADAASLREGPQLHAHVVRMGFRDVFVSTALVDMYVKFGDMGNARKVFDGMPERTPASWNPMIMGYVRGGDPEAAMEMFRCMPERDAAAFNVMIDGFVKMGDVGSARRLFDEMPERNVVSWTSLIFGYCKAGDMGAARELFDEMGEKNLFSWNVMIGGYCQNRQSERALELFRELQSDLCPDEVTIVSIIPAIADMGAIDLARWIHSYARRKGLDRGTNVSNVLVSMYARCGDIVEARRVFDEMPTKETVSWNAMINGLAVNGQAQEALDVFAEMQGSGIRPNELTMIGVLSACSHGGLVEEGRRRFRELEAYGIDRRIEHYGCMVDLLGRGGYLEEAERLIDEIPNNANGVILSSLIFACQNYGDVDRAERLITKAIETEPGNATTNYVMLRNLYASRNRWWDVRRIKEVMGTLGGKQEAGCSVVEIENKVCEFVSGDRAHPEWGMMNKVLAHLELQMKKRRTEGKEELEMAVS